MSEPDGFLTRWSRRKRQAAQAASDAREATPGEQAADGDCADHAAPAVPLTTTESQPAAQPSSLPPIESIEAGTDIRGYLADEVAPDLAREALRRAWVTDPAIRDFVGLADYDWDFNAPDSMAGFGPLRPTDDVRRLLSHMLGDDPAPQQPTRSSDAGSNQGGKALDLPAGVSHQEPKRAESDKQTTETGPGGPAIDTNMSSTEDTSLEGAAELRNSGAPVDTNMSSTSEATAQEGAAFRNSQILASTSADSVGRRHGGALPKCLNDP